MNTGHIPAPAEHSPRKDMITDARGEEVSVWEVDNTFSGAWITCEIEDLVEVRQ